jgi:ABC-type polar amino acid transport system ATPase subunit
MVFFMGFCTDVFFAPFAKLVVTHEMGFAHAVADRMYFFDEGLIVESFMPEDIIHNPQEERTRLFLSQI